jgi:hypothetical protein
VVADRIKPEGAIKHGLVDDLCRSHSEAVVPRNLRPHECIERPVRCRAQNAEERPVVRVETHTSRVRQDGGCCESGEPQVVKPSRYADVRRDRVGVARTHALTLSPRCSRGMSAARAAAVE